MINIENVDKVELLKKLHENQISASFFSMNNIPAPMFDYSNAKECISNGYIDYYCGRAIKTDLSKNDIDPHFYDRDAGIGTFQKIVDNLK